LLVLYQDVDSYDRRRAQDIAIAPAPVAVTLPRVAKRVEVFTPTVDLAEKQSFASTSKFTVAVPDHVAVVRIGL
jgi:hypothetical protein